MYVCMGDHTTSGSNDDWYELLAIHSDSLKCVHVEKSKPKRAGNCGLRGMYRKLLESYDFNRNRLR